MKSLRHQESNPWHFGLLLQKPPRHRWTQCARERGTAHILQSTNHFSGLLILKTKCKHWGKKNHRRSDNYRENTKSYTAVLEGNLLLQCLAFFFACCFNYLELIRAIRAGWGRLTECPSRQRWAAARSGWTLTGTWRIPHCSVGTGTTGLHGTDICASIMKLNIMIISFQ